MKKKVVFAQKALPEALAALGGEYEVKIVTEGDAESLKQELRDAHAVIVGTGTLLNADRIATAQNLQVISRTGIGMDNIDLEAAAQKGICVTNVPAGNAVSVAEHAVALICALGKAIPRYDALVRDGNFQARRLYYSHELSEKTLGIVGLGLIGRLVAQKCHAAFSMRVVAYDPYATDVPAHVTLCDTLREVASQSDYLSLHMPLLPGTRNSVNREILECMKPSAYLVNTGRGGTVDQAALIDALERGVLAGAALDVFEKEPVAADDPILRCEKLILSPHVAGLTQECAIRLACGAIECAVAAMNGERPRHVCNEKQLRANGKWAFGEASH